MDRYLVRYERGDGSIGEDIVGADNEDQAASDVHWEYDGLVDILEVTWWGD